jgi:predicted aspartyl protease
MSFPFDPGQRAIIVDAEVAGPKGVAALGLDTGASYTLVNVALLVAIGYDPAVAPDRVQVTTGSGVEFAARVVLRRLKTLAHERLDFPVLAHTLPPSAGVDGLVGLDFFRGLTLTVDFRKGQITLH